MFPLSTLHPAGHGGAGSALHCTEHLASILRKHLLRRVRTDQGNLMSESSTDSLPPVLSEGLPQPMDEHGPVDRADSTDEDGAMQGWPVLSHEDVTNSLIASFEDCDASIPNSVASEGGTTAVCALVGVDKIWVANCGEYRAPRHSQAPAFQCSPVLASQQRWCSRADPRVATTARRRHSFGS